MSEIKIWGCKNGHHPQGIMKTAGKHYFIISNFPNYGNGGSLIEVIEAVVEIDLNFYTGGRGTRLIYFFSEIEEYEISLSECLDDDYEKTASLLKVYCEELKPQDSEFLEINLKKALQDIDGNKFPEIKRTLEEARKKLKN